MKLPAALKFFRQLMNLQDEFYYNQICRARLFGPILNVVYETMPRNNLLNSACLEMFELIKRDNIKPLIVHVVETYREKLVEITYVDTFQNLVLRYDQMMHHNPEQEAAMADAQEAERGVAVNGNQRWAPGLKEQDAAEEAYFNTSDDEDELGPAPPVSEPPHTNGASPMLRSLIEYADDDFDDPMDTAPIPVASPTPKSDTATETESPKAAPPVSQSPPERLSEKRRRQEDDDEDAFGKLSNPKRRSSMSSVRSVSPTSSPGSNGVLRRKKGFFDRGKDTPNGGEKIKISLSGRKESSKDDVGG